MKHLRLTEQFSSSLLLQKGRLLFRSGVFSPLAPEFAARAARCKKQKIRSKTLHQLLMIIAFCQYTMDTDWLSYYFSPLVTMWFGIIWLTMWLMHPYNKLFVFILAKILLSAFLVGLFFFLEVPLRFLFEISNNVFRTEWNAREWTFRVTLDLLIPYFGMLAALVYIKIAENRLTESPYWPQYAKVGTYIAAAGMIGYILFESQLDKFTYNIFHPYASIVPVIAFAILRNATPYLRSVNSKFFMYFGQCSLETFIIQVRVVYFLLSSV